MVAAGVMVGGALLFAGWGAVQLMTADEVVAQEPGTSATAPADPGERGNNDGTVTVTLPDEDGNGIADPLEEDEGTPGSDDPSTGKGDEDEVGSAPPEPEAQVYVIQEGDTLTKISGETGVPIGVLVEENRIQNPNLIYAGASLLIPPVG